MTPVEHLFTDSSTPTDALRSRHGLGGAVHDRRLSVLMRRSCSITGHGAYSTPLVFLERLVRSSPTAATTQRQLARLPWHFSAVPRQLRISLLRTTPRGTDRRCRMSPRRSPFLSSSVFHIDRRSEQSFPSWAPLHDSLISAPRSEHEPAVPGRLHLPLRHQFPGVRVRSIRCTSRFCKQKSGVLLFTNDSMKRRRAVTSR